jgi:TIR domain
MSDVTEALQSQAPKQDEPLEYDAFLSFTPPDLPIATGIHKGLRQIGRRLGRLRALRVLLDETDSTARPDLSSGNTDAMARARYLIIVLSPQAAASARVDKEVNYWLRHRDRDQLLLLLADGQLQWDEHNQCFDPQVSDAVPPVLTQPGSLPAEPFYIDVGDDAPWDPRASTFRDRIAALAAVIHGKPKDQLISDDERQQRRLAVCRPPR